MEELIALERQGWEALSTSREAAVAFFGGVLAGEAVMVFPGGLCLDGREAILAAIDAQPWTRFELAGPRLLPFGEAARCLLYRAEAQRTGAAPYRALVASTYVAREGAWRLILHQQSSA